MLYHPIGKFLQKATVLDTSVKRLDEVKGKFGKGFFSRKRLSKEAM